MSTKRNRAFTLIELLVVIAIIAILVSIAMPAFRTVQETGRSAKCAGNLRQIGAAMVLFASDHRNLFPESGNAIPWGSTDTSGTSGSGQQSWMQQLGPYVSGTSDPRSSPGGSIFTCPSSSLSNGASGSSTNGSTKYYSYFNGAYAAKVFTGGFAAVNRTLILHPAEQILSGDITDWPYSNGQTDADKDDYTQCPIDVLSTYHNASINLLFYDGHVESEKWNSSLSTPGYFNPSRMCTIYQGTGQLTYTGTAPGH